MARGNQRDKAREANLKKQAGQVRSRSCDWEKLRNTDSINRKRRTP